MQPVVWLHLKKLYEVRDSEKIKTRLRDSESTRYSFNFRLTTRQTACVQTRQHYIQHETHFS